MVDLDLLAQQRSQSILDGLGKVNDFDDVENVVTKTLGVVQENGVYSGTLFLMTRTRPQDKAIAASIRQVLLSLAASLAKVPEVRTADPGQVLKFLTESVCHDLDLLLLVKQVWEQTLIYARFAAKARKTQ